MRTTDLAALMAALILPLSACAVSPTRPPSYVSECGSCHVPYPPNLLSDGGWYEIMSSLPSHFGENVKPEEPVRHQIERYLVNQAGSSDYRFRSQTDPPRLTNTLWFRRTHGEVKTYLANPKVGSSANCMACHPHADIEEYAREDVVLPEPPRR